MARVRYRATKNTGTDFKRHRLAEPDSPTDSEKANYYRDNFAWEWLYVMITLVNVGNALRENLQTAQGVLDVLAERDNAYDVLDYDNVIQEEAHIFVGKQKKEDDTLDVYIMIGVMIDVNSDDPTVPHIRNGINRYLGRGRQTIQVRGEDVCIVRESEDNENFVQWNEHVIKIMDENVESGNRLF